MKKIQKPEKGNLVVKNAGGLNLVLYKASGVISEEEFEKISKMLIAESQSRDRKVYKIY